ncbi:MAG: hypothetical protein E7052_10690 [Lentisphaerae bacterium]|nr:hypothetical protein [Lentisphaerota bacterium]
MSAKNVRPGSGVLIRVADIDLQRVFYRDLLMLGDPVVDSAFWVEFCAPDGSRIILEKSEAAYLVHDVSATTLVLATPHLEAVRKELLSHNYPLTAEEKLHPGEAFYRGQDPEGNVFYLCIQ